MRIPLIAISIWMFICMTLFGVVGYAYVLWSQYWRSPNEKKQLMQHKNANFTKQVGMFPNHLSSHFLSNHLLSGKPNNKDNLSDFPMDKLWSKINTFKTQLMIQLRQKQLVAGNLIFHKAKEESNIYKVNYRRQKRKFSQKSAEQLLCEIKKKVRIEMLSQNTQPFKNLGYANYFPPKAIVEALGYQNSCAMVSSAGSMHKSNLGNEIDSHDIVLRFNSAPTEGYENDVGSKTSIRIINSHIVSKPEFDFFTSPMYRNITLIVWDNSKYHGSLEEWHRKPDIDIFTPYWLHRELFPSQLFYILHPEFVWTAWDFIQSNTLVPIEPHPPSSGFFGILVLLSMCNYVDIYEYVPSMRLTKRCHYFDVHEDIGCTLGDWHPLASEKILSFNLNAASDKDIFVTGKITINGLQKQRC